LLAPISGVPGASQCDMWETQVFTAHKRFLEWQQAGVFEAL
jgi:hypothetical protein